MALVVAGVVPILGYFKVFPLLYLILLISLGVVSYGILSYFFQRDLVQDISRALKSDS